MGKKKGKVGKWGEKIEKPPEKRGEMGKCGAAGRKYGKTQRNLGGKRAIWVGEGETSHSIPPGGRVSMVLWRLRLRMRSRRARGAAAPSPRRMRSSSPHRATRMRVAPRPTAHARSGRQAFYACAVRGCACAVRSAHAQCAPGAVTGRGEGGEGRGRAAHAQCEPRGCSGGAAVGVRGRGG